MIEEREGAQSAQAACRSLDVSTSAYYDWPRRPESKWAVDDRHLAVEIRAVHRQSRQTYGVR